jgi:hypothetical protein
MGKLFNLKEWLTVADAARHLSIVFGEDVTEADVLRLALDGRIRLSVYFVNHAIGRLAKWIPWKEYTELVELTEALDKMHGRKRLRTADEEHKPVLRCDDDLATLTGVWDLPMIGNERLEVEHQYQGMTGGPAVTLQGLDGTFVDGPDGQICQLQESFDENEYQSGSSAALERLERHIAENNIEGTEAESPLNRHKEQRKEFLEKRRTQPAKNNYFPARGLPKDAVIVVRTEALREFESQSNDEPLPSSHAHVSDKLARMNQASTKFWSNADRVVGGTGFFINACRQSGDDHSP